MNFRIEKIKDVYYLSVPPYDMYGPFDKYKEATDFMENDISILYEHGSMIDHSQN